MSEVKCTLTASVLAALTVYIVLFHLTDAGAFQLHDCSQSVISATVV